MNKLVKLVKLDYLITLTISNAPQHGKSIIKCETCLVYANSQQNKNVIKSLLKGLAESIARMSAES